MNIQTNFEQTFLSSNTLVKDLLILFTKTVSIKPHFSCSIQLLFLQKLVRQCPTDVTSFACSLKNGVVGYCGRLSGVRGSALLAEEREGGKNFNCNLSVTVREMIVLRRKRYTGDYFGSKHLPLF